VREALGQAAKLKQELATLQARQAELTKQLNEITTGQERLRQNINTVGRDSSLGKRYLEKLNDEETRIEELRKQTAELQGQIEAKQEELNKYVAELTIGE
jgi:chromosome segregation ATPase